MGAKLANKMKNVVFLLLALFLSVKVNAQFQLTKENFVSTKDETKNYAIIECPDTEKATLYQRAKMYLNSIYNNPKLVITEIGNEQIVIDAIDASDITVIFQLNGSNVWNYCYKYTLDFKDNKVRFSPLFKNLKNTQDGSNIDLIGSNIMGNVSGMFNKKGKCLKGKAKEAVETSVNAYFILLQDAITNNKKEEW